MPSRAEQIVDAVEAALTTTPMTSVPAARVYRDLVGALQSNLLPAVVIEPGNETAPSRQVIGLKVRQLEVLVTVFATSYAAADAPIVEVSSRLLGNPSLGGLTLECDEGVTVREREDAERSRVRVSKVLSYQYRTTEGSIE